MKFAKRMHAEALDISNREDTDVEETNHADVPFVPYKRLKKRIKRLSQSGTHAVYPGDNGAAAEAVDEAAGGGGWYAEPFDHGQSDTDQSRPPPYTCGDTGRERGCGSGDDECAGSDAFLVELDQVCEELDAWFTKLAQVSVGGSVLNYRHVPNSGTLSTTRCERCCAWALSTHTGANCCCLPPSAPLRRASPPLCPSRPLCATLCTPS